MALVSGLSVAQSGRDDAMLLSLLVDWLSGMLGGPPDQRRASQACPNDAGSEPWRTTGMPYAGLGISGRRSCQADQRHALQECRQAVRVSSATAVHQNPDETSWAPGAG